MSRVVAHMVVRNEADRWLDLTLPRLVDQFGEVTVYDDQSTDGTADIARDLGCTVGVRPDDVPSFAAHEGAFREYAWEWTIETLGLASDAWIIVIDADEALPAAAPDQVAEVVGVASEITAFELPIREIFSLQTAGGFPLERVDGEWGRIRGRRLALARPGLFRDKPIASGSVPWSTDAQTWGRLSVPRIWHLGYLRPEDRAEKQARYTGRSQHARTHVKSITTIPTLRPSPVEDTDRPFWTAVQRKLG